MRLRIAHLYADLMNVYGDRGNILTLTRRCQWRGIDVEVQTVTLGDPLRPGDHDLYFFGGGQDREQAVIAGDLQAKGEALRQAVAEGAALLAVCGGYQLLGHYFRPHDGPELPGVGLFDAYTVAGNRRCIGNIVVVCDDFGGRTLVGFENHSGKTYLGRGCRPLGRVRVGFGNNGEDGGEGAVVGGAVGCYLHGSLLPKNPWLADWLIARALARRYGEVSLTPLDDRLEQAAHTAAVERASRLGRARPGLA